MAGIQISNIFQVVLATSSFSGFPPCTLINKHTFLDLPKEERKKVSSTNRYCHAFLNWNLVIWLLRLLKDFEDFSQPWEYNYYIKINADYVHFNLHCHIFANGAFAVFKYGKYHKSLVCGRKVILGKTFILTRSQQPSQFFSPHNISFYLFSVSFR